MSVVTLEQQTLVVMTELADEEISGIVGGGRKGGLDVDNDTDTKVKAKSKNGDVFVIVQTGTATAIGGGDAKVNQSAYQENDKSRDKVYF
ncbi:MAG: hypothetical protein V7K53_06010 [Nostoc sp.]|uniref:hypothetical protein n=1 Tax=Nostoc sp. TaxID=1180 RepID=UPI002FF958D8